MFLLECIVLGVSCMYIVDAVLHHIAPSTTMYINSHPHLHPHPHPPTHLHLHTHPHRKAAAPSTQFTSVLASQLNIASKDHEMLIQFSKDNTVIINGAVVPATYVLCM